MKSQVQGTTKNLADIQSYLHEGKSYMEPYMRVLKIIFQQINKKVRIYTPTPITEPFAICSDWNRLLEVW